MRIYRHIKYWMLMIMGIFCAYHDAQWAAIALFVLAALQPSMDSFYKDQL